MLIILQSDITSMLSNFLPLGLIIIVMYFFFIRPNAQKQKAQDTFVADLAKGMKVVTNSGIIGTITKIDDTIATLKISDKGYLDILKSAISSEMTDSINK